MNNEITLRCPYCFATNIEHVKTSFIGCEIFITYKCLNCGKEEILDEYELERWYE